jgi:NhaP-type Na+/H+ or K+/H+ antiporter
MPPSDAALTVAIALAAGAAIQALARFLRIPAIVVLLAAGAALGPAGLGWVQPSVLGDGLFVLVDFAVAVILFEGALNLDLGRLRREERAIRQLVTTGALITLVGAAAAARFWLSWPWALAALFGALVVVTGPTVVGPLIRNLRLRPRLQTVLEAEGVFIDPIGALLAVLVLQITLAADASQAAAGMRDLGVRLAVGLAIGIAGGFGVAHLLRLARLVHGLENILVLGLVTLLFHLGEHVLSQTGLIAVTVAGVVVGNFENPVVDDLREFKDQLTLLLIGMIFVLLAADVGLAEVRALGWNGLGVVVTLIVIVRPLGVLLVTRGAGLSGRETAFVASIAPRGIVAAAIASLMAATLAANGIAGGADLRALVFLVIAGTVAAAGALAWPLAAVLGLRLPARDRIVILGAQGLGLALATALKARGAIVTLIDADPQRCRQAAEHGFTVVYGDGLQERTLRRGRVELVGTAVGATFNDNLNSQFVRYARQEFDVPRGLVSVGFAENGRPPAHVVRHGADVLFDGAHDQERWDVRWRQEEVTIATFEFLAQESRPDSADAVAGAAGSLEMSERRSDAYVVLTLERNRHVAPMARSAAPRNGDRATMAIYSRAHAQALGELASIGWHPAPEDVAPAAAPASVG